MADAETVALYHMNGSASDASGHGFNGVLSGSSNSWLTYAKYGGGLQTPASSVGGFVAPVSVSSDNFTIEGWVKPDVLDGTHYVFFGSDAFSLPVFYLRLETLGGQTTLVGAVYDSGWVPRSVSGGSLAVGKWTHLAFAVFRPDGGGSHIVLSIYADGALLGSTTYSFDTTPAPMASLSVGRRFPESDSYFKGQVDEVRLSNTARATFTMPFNSPPSLIDNGDFEVPNGTFPTAWSRDRQSGSATFSWSTGHHVSGIRSAKTQMYSSTGMATWGQTVSRIDPTLHYRLRAHVLAVPDPGVSLNGSHAVEVKWLSDAGQQLGTYALSATTANQWQELIAGDAEEIVPPAEATRATISLKAMKKGSYYFDDAVFVPKKENLHTIKMSNTDSRFPLGLWKLPQRNLLRNSTFLQPRSFARTFPLGWDSWIAEDTTGDVAWDTNHQCAGSYFLTLELADFGLAQSSQNVAVDPSLQYRLGGWTAVESIAPTDASDRGNDGAPVGANTWLRQAVFDHGLHATGVDGRSGGGFDLSPSISGANFTVEGWFNADDVSGQKWIFSGLASDGYPVFYVRIQDSMLVFGVWGANGADFDERALTVGLLSDSWYHIALTVSSIGNVVTARPYLNHSLLSAGVVSRPFAALPRNLDVLKVGRALATDDYGSFNGQMDEVRISDVARSELSGGPYVADPNTVGLYHLDDGTGPTLAAIELEWFDANGELVGQPESISSDAPACTHVEKSGILPPLNAARAIVSVRARERGTYSFANVTLEADLDDSQLVADARSAGFNSVNDVDLDVLSAAGMKGVARTNLSVREGDAEAANALANFINANKAHPALRTWLFDEPNNVSDGDPPADTARGYQMVRALDEFYVSAPHRVWLDFGPKGPASDPSNFAALKSFVPAGDLFSMNVYPVPEGSGYGGMLANKSLSSIGEFTDHLASGVLSEGGVQRKPLWMFLQGCSPREGWPGQWEQESHSIELTWLDANGAWLRNDLYPAGWSNEWSHVGEQRIVPPANAASVWLFLRAYALGSDSFDDVEFSELGGSNLVENGTFEAGSGNAPDSWGTDSSSVAPADYAWDASRSKSGARSARITISNAWRNTDWGTLAGPYVTDPHTLALYHLNGSFADASGAGRDGIAFGTGNAWTDPARHGSGLRTLTHQSSGFDASIPISPTSFTLESWIRADSDMNSSCDDEQYLFGGTDVAGAPVLYARQKGQSFAWGLFDPGSRKFREVVAKPLPVGQWQHVAVSASVLNGNQVTMFLYLNNVLAARVTHTFDALPGPIVALRVGRPPWSNSCFLTGQIDEVRVSDIPRSGFGQDGLFTGLADWRQLITGIDPGREYSLSGWIYEQSRPTWQETRFMAYDAIIHGARGLAYWGQIYIPVSSDLWKDLKRIASELDNLSGVLTSPESLLDVSVNRGEIETLLLKASDGLYLLTANRASSPVNGAMITISGLPLNLASRVASETGTLAVSGNSFSDNFNGHQVHVYRVN